MVGLTLNLTYPSAHQLLVICTAVVCFPVCNMGKPVYNFHKATNDNLSAFFSYAPSKSGRMPCQRGKEVREKPDGSEEQGMQAVYRSSWNLRGLLLLRLNILRILIQNIDS